MLHTKFQAPKPNGSEDLFNILLCMIQIKDPLAWDHFIPGGGGGGGHHLNKLSKGPLGHASFQIAHT